MCHCDGGSRSREINSKTNNRINKSKSRGRRSSNRSREKKSSLKSNNLNHSLGKREKKSSSPSLNPVKKEIHVGAGRAEGSDSDLTKKTAILDLETLQWRVGTDFPRGNSYLSYPGYVEAEGDFVTLGGDDIWPGYKNILGFYNDARDEYYLDPTRGMVEGRAGMAAFKVPDAVAPCN